MASLDSKSCSICTDDYNATNHKSVILPCSHEFCLTCLVRMKASQSTDCPQCRQSFADFELPVLPGMVEEISLELSSEDTISQDLCSIKKRYFIGCQLHEKPFVYWSNDKKEFYCIKCVVCLNVMASSLELIDDCVLLIQADITSRAIAADEGITSDWEKHKPLRDEATQQLEKIKKIREAMQQLEVEFGKFIQDIDFHNGSRREQSDMAKKIREAVPEIKSDRDMEMILKYRKSLHELQASTQMPCKTLPATLLSKIACNYAEADGQESAFIKKFSLVTKNCTKETPVVVTKKKYTKDTKEYPICQEAFVEQAQEREMSDAEFATFRSMFLGRSATKPPTSENVEKTQERAVADAESAQREMRRSHTKPRTSKNVEKAQEREVADAESARYQSRLLGRSATKPRTSENAEFRMEQRKVNWHSRYQPRSSGESDTEADTYKRLIPHKVEFGTEQLEQRRSQYHARSSVEAAFFGL